MSNIPTGHALLLSAVLFVLGIAGLVARRNLIFVLISVEIMINAAAVAFVAAGAKWHQADGQTAALFILIVAAAEVAVGLSLLIRIYRMWKDIDSNQLSEMKG